MPDPAPPADLPGDPPAPPPAGGADAPRVEEWETRFTYLYSDFENYRRRTERERETLRIRSEAEVLREVLPIVEAAEKAVEAVQELPRRDPVRRGVELLQQTIASFLETHGVHPVATAGQPFRAEEHEAVAEAPPSAKAPEGAVAEVVQQGYAFSGGLLRPAKVVVARNPPDPAPARSDRPTAPGGPDAPETPP